MRTNTLRFIRPESGFYFGPNDDKGGAGSGTPPEGTDPDEGANGGAGDEGAEGAGDEGAETPLTLTPAQLKDRLAKAERSAIARHDAKLKELADDEKLSETERERKRAEAAEAGTQAERNARVADKIETRAERLALAAGVNAKRVGKFLRLLDLSDHESLSDDGNPDEDAISALITAELAESPEFKTGKAAPEGSSSGDFDGAGSGAPKVWTRAAIDALSLEEFDKHEAEIADQMRKGLVK